MDSSIQGTLGLVLRLSPDGWSTVLCLYQLPLLNGHRYSGDTWPGPEVIPRWMIHCIMFVSVTSVEWTPLFRGHLAWPWGYPLTYYYYGGSTVLFLYQLPLLKGHRYSGDTWPELLLLLLLLWRIHCIIFVSVTSVEGTSLFRGHLAWVCLLKRHLFSGDTWPSWSRVCLLNGRSTVLWMGVFRVPPGLYQNQVKCSAFDMEMIFILMQIKLFCTWKVVHLVSFCQWGFWKLGIGQFVGERK